MTARLVMEETYTGTEAEIRGKIGELFRSMRKQARKPKKRILFLVDNHNWCWTSTARNIAKHIPEYHFQIESAEQFRAHCDEMLAMCDLVYMRGYPFAFLDGLPQINKPYIWTLSTGGENLAMRIEQSLSYSAGASACVVQCERSRREAEAAGIKNVVVIPNGVDVDHFRERGANNFSEYDVGFAGNNEGARGNLKGSGLVADACSKLGIKYREVNKSNRISYSDMPEFYRSVYIYAQPSDSEGCSNSVMEAMSCGLLCLICRGVGYHGEQCHDDEVVFVERSVEDVARKIEFLLRNPIKARDIGRKARAFAERHSWPVMARKHKDMIDNVFSSTMKNPMQTHCKNKCATCVFFKKSKEYIGCGWCILNPRKIFKHGEMLCGQHKHTV